MNHWENELIGAIIFLEALFGFAINIFLLYSNYLKYKSGADIFNLLVTNLGVANLGMIIFCLPLSSIASFKETWIWGEIGCIYYGAAALFFGFAIMINIVMFVLDVFFENSFSNYVFVKSRVRKLMVTWIWLNSGFWSLAPLAGWSRIWFEPTGLSCTVDIMSPDLTYKTYIVSCFVWCYVIPVLIMFYCRLKKRDEYYLIAEERSDYRRVFILMILFVIEWTPYCAVYLWPLFSDPREMPLRLVAFAPVFGKLSVVLNPIVLVR